MISMIQKARSWVTSALNRSVDPSVAQLRALALSLILVFSLVAAVGGTATGTHATDWEQTLDNNVNDVETRTAAPHVYVATGTSLYALDKTTGTVAWSRDVNATAVAWGDGYVFAEVDGILHRFDDVDGGSMTSMGVTVVDRNIYPNPQDDMVFVETGPATEEDLVGLEYDGTEIFRYSESITRGVGYDRKNGWALRGLSDGNDIRVYDGNGDTVKTIRQGSNTVSNNIARGYRYVGSYDGDNGIIIDTESGTTSGSAGRVAQDTGPASLEVYETSGSNITTYNSNGNQVYTHNVTGSTENVGRLSVITADGKEVVFVSYGDTVARHTRQDVDAPSGGSPTGTAQEPAVELQINRWMEHGTTQNYTVIYTNDQGQRQDVTSSATVTSNNTTVVTVDDANTQLVATSDTSINGTSEITAQISGENVTTTVTVANATLDNAQILPGTVRATSMISDDTIFFLIIVAMIMGVIGRYATAFAGLGMGQLAVAIGWWGGYVPEGVAMVSVFLVLFIGFNLAVNVDYTVRA